MKIQTMTRKGVREVTAYQVPDVPGLAVHRLYDKDGEPLQDAWGITHINSGKHIPETNFARRADAIEVAQRLGKVADWTQNESDLYTYSKEITACLRQHLEERMVKAIESATK